MCLKSSLWSIIPDTCHAIRRVFCKNTAFIGYLWYGIATVSRALSAKTDETVIMYLRSKAHVTSNIHIIYRWQEPALNTRDRKIRDNRIINKILKRHWKITSFLRHSSLSSYDARIFNSVEIKWKLQNLNLNGKILYTLLTPSSTFTFTKHNLTII